MSLGSFGGGSFGGGSSDDASRGRALSVNEAFRARSGFTDRFLLLSSDEASS